MLEQIGQLLQQVKELESSFRKMVVIAEQGGGTVKILMNGLQEVVEIRFGPDAQLLLEQGQLAGMINEAFNEALHKSRQLQKDEILRITGGLNLPNIPGLF